MQPSSEMGGESSRQRSGPGPWWTREGTAIVEVESEGLPALKPSSDGSRFVAASRRGGMAVWNADGEVEAELGELTTPSWSADGARLVGARSTNLLLWSAQDGRKVQLGGHTEAISSVEWSSDGGWILSASEDRTARTWSTRPEAIMLGGALEETDHRASDFGPLAAWSPDGSKILTCGGANGPARIWSREGRLLATLHGAGEVFWSVAWSPDGRLCLSASNESVRIWTNDGEAEAVLPITCRSASWDSTGSRILTVSPSWVMVWTTDGEAVLSLTNGERGVRSASWEPQGDTVLTVSSDAARLWDQEGRIFATLPGSDRAAITASWSPDGSHILEVSRSGLGRLHERSSSGLSVIAEFPVYDSSDVPESCRVVWHPSGKSIVAEAFPRGMSLWDLDGRHLATLEGVHAAWNSTGSLLATGGRDGTTRIWDDQGRLVHELEGHRGIVLDNLWSPDDEHLLTASLDGSARIWRLPPWGQALIDEAVDCAPRTLSTEQAKRYFIK